MIRTTPRLRLAFFSPFPPARTGIADYTAELLPWLAESADLTLFADDPQAVDPALAAQFTILPLSAWPAQRFQFDLPLYQMGGNRHYHSQVYPFLLRWPGVMVLHDYNLHHFIGDLTVNANNYAGYSREMGFALGLPGSWLASRIWLGLAEHPTFSVPLNDRALTHSLGVIVHSRFVANEIAARHPDTPVTVVPLLIAPLTGQSRREALGVSAESVIIGSFGHITPSRQMEIALQAFARLLQTVPNLLWLIVGQPEEAVDLPNLCQRLGLQEKVRIVGYAPTLDDFADWMATCDVVVNLRHPTVGETSAAALRAMAAGKPLIVTDQGWYRELPDTICHKVPPDDVDAVFTALERLVRHPAEREAMGATARAIARRDHDPAVVAGQYVAFMRQVLEGIGRKFTR